MRQFEKDIYSSSSSIRQKILNAKRENSSYFICNFFCIHNLYIHSEINIVTQGVINGPYDSQGCQLLTFTWRWGTIYRIMCFSYVCCALLILFLPSSFQRTFLSEKGIEKYISSSSTFSNEVFAFVPERNISIKHNGEILEIAWRENFLSRLSEVGKLPKTNI